METLSTKSVSLNWYNGSAFSEVDEEIRKTAEIPPAPCFWLAKLMASMAPMENPPTATLVVSTF